MKATGQTKIQLRFLFFDEAFVLFVPYFVVAINLRFAAGEIPFCISQFSINPNHQTQIVQLMGIATTIHNILLLYFLGNGSYAKQLAVNFEM